MRMLQSVPNVWYNIDELYTISNRGTIELNTLDNKDRMSATTSTESYQKNLCNKATPQDSSPGANERSCTQKIIRSSKMDFLRHILDTERSMRERLTWSIIIIIIAMLAIIIGICALKSTSRPVLSESYIPVSQLYFPAVTVCPQNKIYKQPSRQNSRITNSSTYEDTNKFEESELRKMLCDSPQDMDEISTFTQQRTSRSADGSLMSRALRFSPQLKNFMHSCKFGNEVCFNEFEKTVTEEGLCFTFNGFNLRDLFNHNLVLPMQEDIIQSDDGEKPFRYMTAGASLPFIATSLTSSATRTSRLSDLQLTSNPRRAASHFQHLTLDLFTINEYAEDSCRADAGFKIFIHDPETTAHTSTAAAVYEVAMDNEMSVTIAPTVYSTAAVAAGSDAYHCHAWRNDHIQKHNRINFDQLERQKLQRFKFYSKANCQYDAIAQYMEQCAGCVPFYMPRKIESIVCNSTSSLLLKKCNEEITSSDIVKHCIPGCEHVSYLISTSLKYYRWTVEHKFRKYTAMSRVIIRFNDQYAVLKQWTENSLIGETCALVLFVLVVVSAFFGISLITLAELFYSLLAVLCRSDKQQPNVINKNDIATDDAIAELDIEKSSDESPTFSNDLRTFRERDAY